MAEQIIQELGFDASKAITGINQAIGALGKLNSALNTTGSTISKLNGNSFNKSLKGVSTSLNRVAGADAKMKKLCNTIAKTNTKTQNLGKSTGGLVISFETLSRIAIAQGIVRGLNAIQAEFAEAVTQAKDFGIALAEAAAIAPGGVDNFQNSVTNLNRELVATSSSFGFDVLDLAEAKYQEFSNQVDNARGSQRLFINANKLARISTSEVSEAVGAISSVLNSYDLSVESSDAITAQLFKTVELGRTRLSDIADQLGNVTPLARNAGIGFTDLGAALATITRSGVSPSRALTQLRAIINQLTKPTAELQKLFTEVLGVEDAQQAIQQFGGLQGVLQEIGNAAGGSSSRVAELFSNIRARNAFNALNQNAERFTENIEKLGEAGQQGAAFLDPLLKAFDDQDAVQFTKAINDLKLAFLSLAQDALPSLTGLIQALTTGVENLGQVVINIGVASFAAYSGWMLVSANSASVLNKAVLGTRAGVLGLAAAIGFGIGELLKFIDTSAQAGEIEAIFAKNEAIKVDNLEKIAKDAETASKAIDELGKKSQESFRILNKASAESRNSIRESNDDFVRSTNSALDRLVSNRSNFIKELDQLIEKSEDRRTKNTDEQSKIREKIEGRAFERQVSGFDDVRQAFFRQARAREALNQATRSGTDEDGLEERLEGLQNAEKLAQDALKTAQQSGNRTSVFQAEKLIDEILRKQLDTKKQQQALDDIQVAKAKEIRDSEKAKLDELKENVKTLQDNLSLFSDQGALLSESDRDDAIKRAKEAFDKIQSSALSRDDLDISQLLGITDLGLKFNEQLSQLTIDPQTDQIQPALDEAARQLTLNIPVKAILDEATQLGLDTAGFDPANPLAGLADIQGQATQALQENAALQKGLADDAAAEAEARSNILGLIDRIVDKNRENAENLQSSFLPTDQFFGAKLGDQVDTLESRLRGVANQSLIDPKNIEQVEQLLLAFESQTAGGIGGTAVFGGFQENLNAIIEGLTKLRELQSQNIGNVGAQNRATGQGAGLTELENTINNAILKQELLTKEVGDSQIAQQSYNSQIEVGIASVGGLANGYAETVRQIAAAEAAQKRLNAAQSQSGGGSAAPRMFGGPLFRAGGGFTPRGSDTVPAMLSPGEFVVNSRSSRKFASQLNAMNAGITPVFRQEGGAVNNNTVNVGDINVNGTSNPDDTARRVVTQLRREFRRGTSSRL